MVENNKTTLKKANPAIVKGDHEEFLKFCTEDTEWTFVGDKKLKGDKGGNIINISSEAGKTPLPTGSVYSATKAALNAITVSLSKEFSGKNIRINSILPGIVETEGSHSAGFIGSDAETKFVANTPLGRTGQPEDIAKVAVFLASDEAAWITGEKISVSGGIYGI